MSRSRRMRFAAVALVAAVAIALPACKAKPDAEDARGGQPAFVPVASGGASPVAASSAAAPSGAAASAVIPGTVTASGNGDALSSPDAAEMTFGVSARDAEAEDAMAAVSKTAEKIAAALKKQSVSEKDIQTAGVSLWPQTDSKGKVSEYHASISVRATVRDIATLGKVIAAATNAGANEVMGPSFTMDDSNPARSKAIEDAITDARARAEVMAKAAGRSLGAVVAVVETGAVSPVYWGERAVKADMAGGVPIEPGQVETAASVSVTFELR